MGIIAKKIKCIYCGKILLEEEQESGICYRCMNEYVDYLLLYYKFNR